jgi:flagellar protein FliO/FliZ
MPNLLQVISALAVVLALIVGASWLLHKVRSQSLGHGQLIHIESSVSVGTRERVVLIEVAGEWVLVGVTPSHISTLMRLKESPLHKTTQTEPAIAAKSWLSTYITKQHAV